MGAKASTVVLSRRNTVAEGLQQSSGEFYSASENYLADVKVERVNIYQGSILSAKRDSVQVTRQEYVYSLCSAPIATAYLRPPGAETGLWPFSRRPNTSTPLLG